MVDTAYYLPQFIEWQKSNAGHKGLRLADNDKNLKSRSALDVKIEVCDYCRPIRGIALYRGLEQR